MAAPVSPEEGRKSSCLAPTYDRLDPVGPKPKILFEVEPPASAQNTDGARTWWQVKSPALCLQKPVISALARLSLLLANTHSPVLEL